MASLTHARATLRDVFGFDAFLPGQERVVEHLLAGHSTAAVFPTGGGKSLCYQLPALCLPGLTLVVSPLVALMKDQIDALERRGVAAARLDASLSFDEARATMAAVRDGRLDLLYVAPERFNNERFREQARRLRIALFAVDEAHCISEWGHNFRPDYLKLAHYAHAWGAERILALTATATPPVLDDIRQGLGIAPEHAVRTGFHRPNLTLVTTPVAIDQRDAVLRERLARREPGSAIVYVTLQKTAEPVAEMLRAAGHDAIAYHAGMPTPARVTAQEHFLASEKAIVVATIAFGMGIDKADIRAVYHYNPPKSLENWAQEIGRAGRDGAPSVCETLLCPDDLTVLRNFAHGDTPSLASVQSLADDLFQGDQDALELNLHALSRRHDIRPLVLRTLLTYLELDGLLAAGTPFYASYKFKPLFPSREILAHFEGDEKRLLIGLFRRAQKARTWFTIDVDAATEALDQPRGRIIRALDDLGERKLLEVQTAGVRHRYTRLRRPDDTAAVAVSLHQRTNAHETRELGRLEQVLELATLRACQSAHLSHHFGETIETPCGHCSWCLDGDIPALPPVAVVPIDPERWRQAEAVRATHLDALGEPRGFARFLAGLTSPRLGQQRLASHPSFGIFSEVPFRDLLHAARAENSEHSEPDS